MAHLDYQTDTQTTVADDDSGRLYRRRGKRLLDLAIAVVLLPVLVPVIALLCLIVRRDGAPGLFAHTRIGRNGTPFTCWKIRTMVPDAQARLASYLQQNPDAAAEWDRTQKLQDDPRITRIGRFLRRTSLDELPQLWNVLRGEMSLVGPRPITAPELDRYGVHRHVYLSLKPGITGQWQVAGRSNGCYAERLQMDQTYARSICLAQDMSLILRTARVVIQPTGR